MSEPLDLAAFNKIRLLTIVQTLIFSKPIMLHTVRSETRITLETLPENQWFGQ